MVEQILILFKIVSTVAGLDEVFFAEENERGIVASYRYLFNSKTEENVELCLNELIRTENKCIRGEIAKMLSKEMLVNLKELIKKRLVNELNLRQYSPMNDEISTFISVLTNIGYPLEEIVKEAGLERLFPDLNREVEVPKNPNLLRRVEQYPMRTWVAVSLFLLTKITTYLEYLFIAYLFNQFNNPPPNPDN